jgi:hypothetical protein
MIFEYKHNHSGGEVRIKVKRFEEFGSAPSIHVSFSIDNKEARV